MTFVEAAIEVLRREGKPLPVKRLAELAVKNNLLSVVGRDPEGTMQARLADAVETPRSDLLELRPGIYGLRVYPPPPTVVEAAPAPAAKEAAEGEAADGADGGERKRRRRGRRGRGKGEAAEAAPVVAAPVAASPKAAEEVAEEAPAADAAPAAQEEAGEGGKRRRRSRRGGRGRRRDAAVDDGAAVDDKAAANGAAVGDEPVADEATVAAKTARESEAPPAAEEAPPAADRAPPSAVAAPADDDLGEGELLEDDEVDLPSGPLLAPNHGAEEMTRTDEERVVRPEIHGRREERGRHRRDHGRGRREGAPQGQPRPPQTPQPQSPSPSPQTQTPAHSSVQAPQAPSPSARRSVLDAVLELLRQSDGRPLHVRHLTETAVNRKLVDGQPNELLRQVRAALVRDVREREAEGLRARVRSLGGGHFALVDKKLDPDLAQAERELAEKAARQRDATRTALRRRLGRMAPPAFEALGRALLDKLGVTGVELVRRGEGVAYFGGVRQLGVGALKTLVALRPGEAEIGRRAVGELRAGLAARGYDEGLLLGAGRLAPDGAAELKAGSGVVLHDGLTLATLLIKHGLGVRRLHLPVDYLDLEFLGELTEG